MKIKKLVRKEYKTIDKNKPVSEALQLFEENKRTIVIQDKDNKYSGILTEREIIRSATSIDKMKVSTFVTNVPKVDVDTPLSECARLMIENDILALPVFEKNKLVGLIEDLHLLKNIPEDIKKQKISEYMSKDLETTRPDKKISELLAEFRKKQISRMPVLEDNKMSGIVTIHDIVSKSIMPKKRQNLGSVMTEKKAKLDLSVENIMTKNVITDYETSTVGSIIEKMIENEINSIVIIDQKQRLKGIITRKDLLEPFAEKVAGLVPPVIYVGSKIENLNRKQIADIITEYSEKNQHLLKRSFYNVYVTEHNESFRESKHDRLYVRLRVHTPAGRYVAAGSGWNINNAMRNSLEKIDIQIEKKLQTDKTTKKKNFLKGQSVSQIKENYEGR